MRFHFSEDQLLFQSTVRDFLEKECMGWWSANRLHLACAFGGRVHKDHFRARFIVSLRTILGALYRGDRLWRKRTWRHAPGLPPIPPVDSGVVAVACT